MLRSCAALVTLAGSFGFALVAAGGEAAPAANVAAGRATYDRLCATCHGPEGQGNGPASDQFGTFPADFQVGVFKFDADSDGTPGTDADLRLVIGQGAAAFGGNPLMVPWPALSAAELDDLLAFVRSLAR
jgi:mono/diheme cytochrome c family protein